jgi:hypothetical protein
MREVIEKHFRFKQPCGLLESLRGTRKDQGFFYWLKKSWQYRKSRRCSIIHKGQYIFSPTEAHKIKPKLVEEFTIKKIYYDTEKEQKEAMIKMPDYECWDNKRKVLCKCI